MRRVTGLAGFLNDIPEPVWLGLGAAVVLGIVLLAIRAIR